MLETRFHTAQLPGANQHAALFDTTRWFGELGPAAALPAPGERISWLEGWRFEGWVKPVGQAVTLQFYIRTGNAGTNADWELDTTVDGTSNTGAVSVAAGATRLISWLPKAGAARLNILAGATGPTSIDAGGKFVGRDSGA